MNIGEAVIALQNGNTVSRTGWNGVNMYLTMQFPTSTSKMDLPYVYITTVQDEKVPWLCSQTDLLAQDWYVT